MKLTLPDGSTKEVEQGITGMQVAEGIGQRLAKDALAIKVNGELRDLSRPIEKGAKIQIITFKDEEGKNIFRHSTAHIFAHAITKLYPDTKITIGPAVEDGFYYDVDGLKITPDDFLKIEEAMQEIINANYPFERHLWKLKDVEKNQGSNPYKLELAKDFQEKGWELTAYKDGDFIDLCEGPHVPSTGHIKAFKLTKIAAAYWRGDQKNKQLTRVYGISFSDKKELRAYVQQQEEAEKRDHVKLGKQLGLFVSSDIIGKGLPLLVFLVSSPICCCNFC